MEKITVRDMDINIDLHNKITSVIGPTGAGKTYLAKKLCNRVYNNDVFIDDKNIKDYDINYLKSNIVVVIDDNYFNCEYVSDELFFYLDKLGYSVSESTKRIEGIAKHFKILNYLDKRIDAVNIEEKMLIKILALLIVKPEIIVIDNLLCYLSQTYVELLIKYLKKNNICLINMTNNSEELLLSQGVVVLNNMKAVICTDAENVLKGNSILPYMGIKLPFVVDLSQNLILYNVVDKVYFDNRKLVDKLWK